MNDLVLSVILGVTVLYGLLSGLNNWFIGIVGTLTARGTTQGLLGKILDIIFLLAVVYIGLNYETFWALARYFQI